MDRRSAIQHAGLAGVLAAGVAPAAHAQAVVRWRLASSFPKTLDTLFGAAEAFARKLNDMSGGKFEVSVHAPGEITSAFGVQEAVQQGAVEMAHTAATYFFGKDDAFTLSCSVPFGLNSRQMSAWMLQGNGLKLTREFYARYNIVNFPGGNTGTQMGGWFRQEVRGVADLKGLKFRVGGFAGRVMERMGMVPRHLPASDIAPALEKGLLDGAEWAGPYDDQKLGLNKAAPYYYYPGWWEGGPQLEFFVHSRAWESLSAEHKAMFEAAAAAVHGEVQARYDVKNPAALKQLVAARTKVLPFPREVMDRAFRESTALYADLSAKNPAWRRIYADFAAFRREQNLWFRFTEARFDSFVQAQKL